MKARQNNNLGSRTQRERRIALEPLETRALLAVANEVFLGPPLTPLKVLAREGVNTAPVAIAWMLSAYESQLASGPIADLQAGRATSTSSSPR